MLAERVRLEFYGYPADYLETYKAALEKVTVADLNAAAKKYIHPDKLAVLVVGQWPGDQAGAGCIEDGAGAPHRHHHSRSAGREERRDGRTSSEQGTSEVEAIHTEAGSCNYGCRQGHAAEVAPAEGAARNWRQAAAESCDRDCWPPRGARRYLRDRWPPG